MSPQDEIDFLRTQLRDAQIRNEQLSNALKEQHAHLSEWVTKAEKYKNEWQFRAAIAAMHGLVSRPNHSGGLSESEIRHNAEDAIAQAAALLKLMGD
jgi:hypothetical protein